MAEEILRYIIDPSGATSGAEQVKTAVKGVGQASDAAGQQAATAGGRFEGFGRQVLASAVGFTAVTAGAQALQGAFRGVIGGAIDFESSFAGVRKTVDGSPAELSAIAAGFREMAREIPVNVNELNAIGEAAGQLGIKKENIVSFSRVMADLGVTTNLSSDQAATSLARLSNITQMSQGDFDRLGSTIVALGNNSATTEAEIVSMGLRIAGAGAQVGLSEAEILAFAAALSSVGIEADAGGSAFSRVMVDINQAVEEGGEKVEAFASVAGMTVPEFSRLFREDAAGAISAFVLGLGDLAESGGNVFGVLETLELSEIRVRDALLRASGAGDLMNTTLDIGRQAWSDNNALTKEAEQRYETTASQIAIAKQNLADLGITIGTAVLPVLGGMAEGLSGMLQAFSALPESTQAVLLLGLAMAPLAPLVAGLITKLPVMWAAFRAGAIGANVALGPIVLGVTALVALADALVAKFTGKSMFDHIFGSTSEAERIAAVAERVRAALTGLSDSEKVSRVVGDIGARMGELAEATKRQGEAVADLSARDRAFTMEDTAREVDRLGESLAANVLTLYDLEGGANANTEAMLRLRQIYTELPPEVQALVSQSEAFAGHMENFNAKLAESDTALLTFEEDVRAATQSVADANEAARNGGDELVTYMSGTWGPTLSAVFSTFKDETAAKLAALREEDFPPLESSAEELQEWLEQKFGQEAGETFEKFRDRAQKAFEDTLSAIQGMLPKVGESFDEWKRRMDDLVTAQANMKGNLQTIWKGITDAGVQMPADLLAAIAEQGPQYVEYFTRLFSEDPQAALEQLKLIAPQLTAETWDAMVKEIIGAAPNVDLALQRALIQPLNGAIADAKSAAATGGQEIGRDLTLGIIAGIEHEGPGISWALMGVVNEAVDKAKGPEGIDAKSPSKKTAELIGKPIIQGITKGMLEELPNALAAVGQATGAIIGAAVAVSQGATPYGHFSLDPNLPFGVTPEEAEAWRLAANGGVNPANTVIHGQASVGKVFAGPNGTFEPVAEGTFDPSAAGGRGMYFYGGAWHMSPPDAGYGQAGNGVGKGAGVVNGDDYPIPFGTMLGGAPAIGFDEVKAQIAAASGRVPTDAEVQDVINGMLDMDMMSLAFGANDYVGGSYLDYHMGKQLLGLKGQMSQYGHGTGAYGASLAKSIGYYDVQTGYSGQPTPGAGGFGGGGGGGGITVNIGTFNVSGGNLSDMQRAGQEFGAALKATLHGMGVN